MRSFRPLEGGDDQENEIAFSFFTLPPPRPIALFVARLSPTPYVAHPFAQPWHHPPLKRGVRLGLLLSTACANSPSPSTSNNIEAKEKDYKSLMDWLVMQSNDYSGVLNPRQTWILSYDGYLIKEEYFWDGEPEITIEFDIRNIEKAQIEQRFTNSIVLYPKDHDTEHFKVERIEEGEVKTIESEYYNWMVLPESKEEVLARLQQVLKLVAE